MNAELIDLEPILALAGLGLALAGLPLLWLLRRHRAAGTPARLRALTVLTLFLTFDLVLFGAYTRLSDSGLGCPDWPGCYGSASPIGAKAQIHAEESTLPSGPVTRRKAWVEMIHRYLATGVGALITLLALWSWRAARRPAADGSRLPISPAWAALTWLWVCAQGAFGALTVTMKLNPGIVTLHLLGGIGLLALLVVQAQRYTAGAAGGAPGTSGTSAADRSAGLAWWPSPLQLSPRLRQAVAAVLLLVIVQVALGGWVSTNYAVLACSDFPTCQGRWWPEMDFTHAYAWRPGLGLGPDGEHLSFATLTAIHMSHRLAAVLVLAALLALAWALHRLPAGQATVAGTTAMAEMADRRRYARWLVALALWQLASGLSNVVLGWPLLAALAHTGGAAALVTVLAAALAAAHPVAAARRPTPLDRPAVAPT